MQISDFLSVADVMMDLRVANKHQLLLEMSRRAASGLSMAPEEICRELEKREQLGSTGMGAGVAIPHARLRLGRAIAVAARLKPPIDFDAIDGEPVDVVVMLLMPIPPSADHLAMLALIARKLKARDNIAKIRNAATAPEIFGVFTGT